VIDSLNRSLKARRVVMGTASSTGVPNAVPIGIARSIDAETLVFVDNYFLKTRANLEENPRVSLTFWDMEEKEGVLVTRSAYQLKGTVKIEDSGPLYDKIRTEVKAIRPELPARAIVLAKIEEIFDIKTGPNAGRQIL
jgi:hypothetical protein